MKNKFYADFSKEKFNQNRNYEAIMHKVREKKQMKRRKLANLVAVLAVVIVIGCMTPAIYAKIKWNIEFKEYTQKMVETPKETINSAKESGFADLIDEDYVVKDGIGIKLDLFLLTDDCLDTRVSFKFAEEKEVDSDSFEFGYVIYDENKNIYDLHTRMYMDWSKEHDLMIDILDKLGVNYDPNAILASILNDSSTIERVETTENRTIIKDITLRAKDSFPKSEKIYIQFFDLGCFMMDLDGIQGQVDTSQIDTENFWLTDEEWIFERDLSEKFSERQTFELVLKEEIPDFEIEKCTLTETGMVLIFKSEEYMKLVGTSKEVNGKMMDPTRNMVTITDGEGKQYENLESGGTENGMYKMNIDVGKKDWEKKLFLNFTMDNQKYISELVVKE